MTIRCSSMLSATRPGRCAASRRSFSAARAGQRQLHTVGCADIVRLSRSDRRARLRAGCVHRAARRSRPRPTCPRGTRIDLCNIPEASRTPEVLGDAGAGARLARRQRARKKFAPSSTCPPHGKTTWHCSTKRSATSCAASCAAPSKVKSPVQLLHHGRRRHARRRPGRFYHAAHQEPARQSRVHDATTMRALFSRRRSRGAARRLAATGLSASRRRQRRQRT